MRKFITIIMLTVIILSPMTIYASENKDNHPINNKEIESEIYNLESILKYLTSPYEIVNDNKPYFNKFDYSADKTFKNFSKLDNLGRCGQAIACLGFESINENEPEEQNYDKFEPSGYHTNKYDFIEGEYLYKCCQLISCRLSGEFNNENLITGTQYMNANGLNYFENKIIDYLKENKQNHVIYRVTPLFCNDNLLSSGIELEAEALEDDKLRFNVFIYNIQPPVDIDYANGDNFLLPEDEPQELPYIVNVNTKRFHKPNCPFVKLIDGRHIRSITYDRNKLIITNHMPCKKCKP